ncbi:MAG: hypothetical protein ABIV47_17935 [Roseiflexaceae bacterium]
MTIGFPTNTVILIIAAMLAAGVGTWLSLSHGVRVVVIAAPARRAWIWGIALVLAIWLLARVALALTSPGGALLGLGISIAFLVGGLLIGILPLLISPTFRQIVRAVPPSWLIGVHAIRIGGFLFLALLDMHLLPAAFALPAGYGDITVGLLALVLMYVYKQRAPYTHALVIAWNGLGLLDFAVALATGFSVVGTFAGQVAAAGVAPGYLNYVGIVPSFGVPLYILLHIYFLYQIGWAQAATTARHRSAARTAAQ